MNFISIILDFLILLIKRWNARGSENYGMEANWYAF